MRTGARDDGKNRCDAGQCRGYCEEIHGADNRKAGQGKRHDENNAIGGWGARQTGNAKTKRGTDQKKKAGAKVVTIENLHVAAARADGQRRSLPSWWQSSRAWPPARAAPP